MSEKIFNSINALDKQLFSKYEFFRKRDGFFIEAGANDGVRQSNTLFFEEYLGWKGILVEPILKVYKECLKHRYWRNAIYNYALVSDTYDDERIIIEYSPETHGLMSVPKGLPHTKQHLEKAHEEGVGVWCMPITLNKILTQQNVKYVDLLVLDVEGYEPQALRGCDFGKYHIEYILIESQYNPEEIEKLLSPYYNKIDKLSYHDYLWKRK